MTDQEKIAALAAELQRLGKMPWWIEYGRIFDAIEIGEDGARVSVENDDAALAALSGIAAEVCAYDQRAPIHSVRNHWVVLDPLNGKALSAPCKTYHEALIAALKQIENEEVTK